jgi:SAM-dependent methyltransferase
MNRPTYDAQFYSAYAGTSLRSAHEVLAVVQSFVQPRSVVDVGCGVGTWLKVWLDAGVNNVIGIDGEYVRREDLLIPPDRFQPMDLTAPGQLPMQFDLVQSLEVAEHLPPDAAEAFVALLCGLGSIVLFSAAIPYQGGTRHINEQWPDYWAGLFAQRGYVAMDVVRDRVWNNPNVAYYYAQNAIMFVRENDQQAMKKFHAYLSIPPYCLSRVHPRKWHEKNEKPIPLLDLIRMVPASVVDLVFKATRKTRRVLAQRSSFISRQLEGVHK